MKTALLTWRSHVEQWQGCTRCELHQCRSQVVLARGSIPADVLFIGEAPGRSEDVALTSEGLGKPFVGPAGKEMDDWITEAFEGFKLRYALTNLIGCIPIDLHGVRTSFDDSTPREGVGDLTEPPFESVRACAPRLREFVHLAKPRLIVRVGTHAVEYLDPTWKDSVKLNWPCATADIVHPSAYLREKKVVIKSSMRRRAIVVLRTAVEKLCLQS